MTGAQLTDLYQQPEIRLVRNTLDQRQNRIAELKRLGFTADCAGLDMTQIDGLISQAMRCGASRDSGVFRRRRLR